MRKLAKVMVVASLVSCASKPPPKAAPESAIVDIPKVNEDKAPLPKSCVDYQQYVEKAGELCDRPTIYCLLNVREMLLDELKKAGNPLLSISISEGKPERFLGSSDEVLDLLLTVHGNGELSITEDDPGAASTGIAGFRMPFLDALQTAQRLTEEYLILVDRTNVLFVNVKKTGKRSVKLYYHEDVFCQDRKERERIVNEKFAKEHGYDEYDVDESEIEDWE